MADASEATPVVDETENNRFTMTEDGTLAELDYEVDRGRLVLLHTGVPEALGGRGIGGQLVRAAVDRAERDGLEIVPVCSFARHWLETHPDAASSARVDFRPDA